jgi:hypothetical protein
VIGPDFGDRFIWVNTVWHGAGLPAAIDQMIKNNAAVNIPVLQIDEPVRQHDVSLFELAVAPVVEKHRLPMVTQPELETDVTFGLGRLVIWLNVQKGGVLLPVRIFCSIAVALERAFRFFRRRGKRRGMRLLKPTRK